jgi:hypothetical protein
MTRVREPAITVYLMPTNEQPVDRDTRSAALSELLARAEDVLQRAAWAIKRNDQLQA